MYVPSATMMASAAAAVIICFMTHVLRACACAWRILACMCMCGGWRVFYFQSIPQVAATQGVASRRVTPQPQYWSFKRCVSVSVSVDCTALLPLGYCFLTVALRLLFLFFLACSLLSITHPVAACRPRVPKNAHIHTHTHTERQTRLLHCCCPFDLNCPATHTHRHTLRPPACFFMHVFLTHVIPLSPSLSSFLLYMHFCETCWK